jgi:lipase ATG15
LSSTSSCQHPGWFGCKDPTSATSGSTPTPTPTPTPSPSTATCTSKGFFGLICYDKSGDRTANVADEMMEM